MKSKLINTVFTEGEMKEKKGGRKREREATEIIHISEAIAGHRPMGSVSVRTGRGPRGARGVHSPVTLGIPAGVGQAGPPRPPRLVPTIQQAVAGEQAGHRQPLVPWTEGQESLCLQPMLWGGPENCPETLQTPSAPEAHLPGSRCP